MRKVDRATMERKARCDPGYDPPAPRSGRRSSLGELSGGTAAARSARRALIVEPETLLLDEPLSNLDPICAIEMRFEVRSLPRRVSVHHGLRNARPVGAMTTADWIAVMNAAGFETGGLAEDILRADAIGIRRPRHRLEQRLKGRVLDDCHLASSRLDAAHGSGGKFGRRRRGRGSPTTAAVRAIAKMPTQPKCAAELGAAGVPRRKP